MIRLFLKKESIPKLVEAGWVYSSHFPPRKKVPVLSSDGSVDYPNFNFLLSDLYTSVKSAIERITVREILPLVSPDRLGHYVVILPMGVGVVSGERRVEAILKSEDDRSVLEMVGTNFNDVKEVYFKIVNGEVKPSSPWVIEREYEHHVEPFVASEDVGFPMMIHEIDNWLKAHPEVIVEERLPVGQPHMGDGAILIFYKVLITKTP